MNGAVSVSNSATVPYKKTIHFNQSAATCTNFVCDSDPRSDTLTPVRAIVAVLLLIGALLATAAGVLTLAIHGRTCSPHEGGSGCGFKLVLAIPWIVALGLAACAIAMTLRRR